MSSTAELTTLSDAEAAVETTEEAAVTITVDAQRAVDAYQRMLLAQQQLDAARTEWRATVDGLATEDGPAYYAATDMIRDEVLTPRHALKAEKVESLEG